MSLIVNLELGRKLTNQELFEVFGCGNSGGMRRSKKTNSLIIISSHVKSIYDDRWDGETLLYTGMGQNGDQSLEFQQNKTLNESNKNGVNVYLFEQFKVNEYTFLGPVKLIDTPCIEDQLGENGLIRKVYIFPLKLQANERFIEQTSVQEWKKGTQKKASKLSLNELKRRALNSAAKCGEYKTIVRQYVRDEYVVEYAKRLANGICQLCEQPAPFTDKKGQPYLETHHIEWLVRGGEDTIYNTVALCPNCHKRMHIVDSSKDKEKLMQNMMLMLGMEVSSL